MKNRPSAGGAKQNTSDSGPGLRKRWVPAATAVVAGVVALAVIAFAQRDLDEARSDRDAMDAAAEAVSSERSRVAAQVDEAELRRAEATDEAEAAEAAREIQRDRLRDQGLSELTVERVVQEVLANADLVEWRRQQTSAVVDRQAREIPQMEECMTAARRAINSAFNVTIDPNVQVPGPSEVCSALLAAPAP